jgi:cell envelope opacity-associated protein A
MKINEISHPLSTFIATVRVVMRNSSTTARTIIIADNFMSAKALVAKIYGTENILSLTQVTNETVIDEQTKTLSSAELQVKSMSDRAKQINQQAKQVKAQKKLQTANTNLLKATSTAQ